MIHLMARCAVAFAVLCAIALATLSGDGLAQTLPVAPQQAAPQTPQIPDTLTPDMVDGMLARLTDAQIREILRAELSERAEEAASTDMGISLAEAANQRLFALGETIWTRLTRWGDQLSNLPDRMPEAAERLATAQNGTLAMIAAALAVIAAGIAAGALVGAATARWRHWLAASTTGYWDKVVRTIALGVLEYLPVFVFVAATRLAAAGLGPSLGPLNDMVWIYHVGVSSAWTFLVVARRAFAPYATNIRIAPMDDETAYKLYQLLRYAVLIGTAGWLLAGFSPTFGFGFAPAMLTVAAFGTAVAAVLMVATVRSSSRIKGVVANLFGASEAAPGALKRISVAGAPAVLLIYLVVAWIYWLALWLERGQHHLEGPIGLLLLLMVAPIAVRMGREAAATAVTATSPRAIRVREALTWAWTMVVCAAVVLLGLRLWGLDLIGLATGPGAPAWMDAAFEIAITLFMGAIIWRLLRAALHTSERLGHGAEEGEDGLEQASSRIDTLTPLFRKLLLGFLAVIVVMIVLSSMGVNIGPLLASAGIVGIAVGFGAQTLVRDIFSGIFFLLDDAFRVGEYIELDSETRGEVEAISVRSLQLRHHRGAVVTIPFGEMKQVTNHNRDWVIYKMSFRLEPDTDPQHVKKVVKAVSKELAEHPEHGSKFIEPLKSQGVYGIDDDSALIIRVKFMSKPRAQFVLRREVYHRLQTAFSDAGVQFARRKVEVVASGGQGTNAPTEMVQAAAEALPDAVR